MKIWLNRKKEIMRADQHISLPHLVYLNPTPLLFKKKVVIKKKKDSEIGKKNFPLDCRACRNEFIDI